MSAGDIATSIGTALTGIGLFYTGFQLRLSWKTGRSTFLLQLYQMMDQHNELHARLIGLGWPEGRKGPETHEEWIQVGRALGLFEYINILVKDGFLDLKTVDSLYAYRLFHLVNNEVIRGRHFSGSGGWEGVVELWSKLDSKPMFRSLAVKFGVDHAPPSI